MFDAVDLFAGDDVDALSAVHAVFVQRGDTVRLQQTCAALADRCCTIYSQRPAACRQFECGVLAGLQRGELTESEAHAIVGRAVAAIRDVRPGLEALAALLAPSTGLGDLARLAGLPPAPTAARQLDRPSFPMLLEQVQSRLSQCPDGDELRDRHESLLAASAELYALLVASFAPQRGA